MIFMSMKILLQKLSFLFISSGISDVTLDYAIAGSSSASSSDYTLSAGTVTIPAGLMSATLLFL